MNKKQYLKKIKWHSLFINNKQRKEILNEIEASLHDFDDTHNSIIEHYGSPKELLQNYLENYNIEPSLLKIFFNISKLPSSL